MSSELKKRWNAEVGHMTEQPGMTEWLSVLDKQLAGLKESDSSQPPKAYFQSTRPSKPKAHVLQCGGLKVRFGLQP